MTQHCPRREPRQPSHPALVRMEAAIQHGRTAAFSRALEELLEDRQGTHGLWQHRALGLILRSTRSDGAETFLKQLMSCPKPPQPGTKENFAGLALVRGQDWALPLLAARGFKVRDSAIEGASPLDTLGRQIAKGSWPVPDLIAPDFLASNRGLACLTASLGMEALAVHHYKRGQGFFQPEHVARLIQFAKDTLPTTYALHTLSQTIGKAVAGCARVGTWVHMDPQGAWKEGMAQLVEAGLMDLPTLHEHLDRLGEDGLMMREFIGRSLAGALEQRMEQLTPQASAPPLRGVRPRL